VNISLVGCISHFDTISFSKVGPLLKSDAEGLKNVFINSLLQRKANTQEASKPNPLNKGTTAYHIIKFIETVMDVLVKHNKKDLFIIMVNYRIHHSCFVVEAINRRAYNLCVCHHVLFF
jgi:hypothetical protein